MLERREITSETLDAILGLSVRANQSHLVAPNAVTIPQAAYEDGAYVWGLWLGNTPVGLIGMLHPHEAELEEGEDPEAAHLWRLMVAAEHQGKGYGRAAIEVCIAQTRAWGLPRLASSVVDAPDSNMAFYQGMGFRQTGGVVDTELVIVMEV